MFLWRRVLLSAEGVKHDPRPGTSSQPIPSCPTLCGASNCLLAGPLQTPSRVRRHAIGTTTTITESRVLGDQWRQ